MKLIILFWNIQEPEMNEYKKKRLTIEEVIMLTYHY